MKYKITIVCLVFAILILSTMVIYLSVERVKLIETINVEVARNNDLSYMVNTLNKIIAGYIRECNTRLMI